MNWSDWIALIACIAACLALVPAFAPMLKSRKEDKDTDQPDGSAQQQVTAKNRKPVKLNDFGKALVLTSAGLAIGVIELVLFSAVAGLFDVTVDVKTMPTNWLVVFYGLFLLPGVSLYWALAHLFNLFE